MPMPSLARVLASTCVALLAIVALTATARTARADGAKQGGDVAGVLATESKPMEAPRPKPKSTANAKPPAHARGQHAGHAKPHHHGRAAQPGKGAGHIKAAKAKPRSGPAKTTTPKKGPKLRA